MTVLPPPTVSRIDPCADDSWMALIRTHDSDVFHTPAWMRVLQDTYGFEPRATILAGEDGPHAGFAHIEVDGVAGRRAVSLPFSDFCDPLVRTADEWTRIVDDVAQGEIPIVVRTRANEVAPADSRFRETGRARWHGLDLGPGRDDLWSNLHESARRAVRKARKSGVTVEPATAEADVRAFYEMHLGVRKYKYRLLAQPFRFFESIWHHFLAGDDGFILLARVDDQVIGGALFLQWQDRLYYKFNASVAGSLAVRPNDLVIWTAIEMALERGLGRLDFGLTDWEQESLARYKLKFGSDEGVLRFLRFGGPSESVAWTGEALPLLTELLTDEAVPDDITEKAAFLYRYFA